MISIEKLRVAHLGSAKIVAKFGDKYLPIFERLHKEIMIVEATADLKILAIRIGSQSANESLGV